MATLLKLIKKYKFKGNISYFIGDKIELSNTYVNTVL